MEKMINILAPFEELTCLVNCSDSFASDVIPAVTVLQRLLSKEVDEDHCVKMMKNTLQSTKQKCFSDMEQNPLYYVTTLLNPRYKDRFFSNADAGRQAKNTFLLEMLEISVQVLQEATPEVLEKPAARRPHTDHQPGIGVDGVFQEIAYPSTIEKSAPTAATIQLEAYLGEVTAPRSDKPLGYWVVNKLRFPTLGQMAQKYLSAPCSSVESERLFSAGSHIVIDTRNRLLTQHAEILLFLKKKKLATCV
ncbi:hypothetical protein AB205_0207490 [Aquarana catesbeiana]|uniref:HAT C-terminal dimerisation domain-containing protein n=1 Tax=Aquarana catesbeiana TaxID=8400 RepID=A0A2G9R6H1_AQUCT|nr:hypothetical protein AB205_0207490 [Aquarana catesbeiana]